MNKWLYTAFLLILSVALVYAQGVPSQQTPRLMVDETGSLVNDSNPLPVKTIGTIGTGTFDAGAPPTTQSTTLVSVTSTPQNVTSLVNRNSGTIINHSSTDFIYASVDASTASATVGAGIPIAPYGSFSYRLDSSKVLSLVTATTATATFYQDGY